MYKRVVAFPDGKVIFYYCDRTVTYTKNNNIPQINFTTKGLNDPMGHSAMVPTYISRFSYN